MFCGKDLVKVRTDDKTIKLKCGFGGSKVDVLCAKTEEGNLITVLTADKNELKEYMDMYDIVEHRQETIDDIVVLPEIFFEKSIKDKKIVTVFVLGVGKSIEIIRNDSLNHLFE